ncbi:hypothetical protein A7K94_0209525 [Modestobacter sp. VKM Ac-2676]|nr:hypothetical protein A7K94_0209525 [Modestobacter sp. VKM Ac-2676]
MVGAEGRAGEVGHASSMPGTPGVRRRGSSAGILAGMSKRTVVAGVAWLVLTVLAFQADPILGAVVLIFGAAGVVVVQLSSTWNEHPDFEAREVVRARRRKAGGRRTPTSASATGGVTRRTRRARPRRRRRPGSAPSSDPGAPVGNSVDPPGPGP